MEDAPSVSVIVPVWNGEATIGATIRSLLDQTYPRDAVQIIVVDNGSSDNTKKIVADFAGVLLLEQMKPGSYAARNKGLQKATGKYVAFTDADCIADRGWLAAAIPVLESDPAIGVLAGHIEVVPGAEGSRSAFLVERELSFKQKEAAQRSTCVTANWVSRRNLVEEAGGFNEKVKSGGDWILSSRLAASGHRIVYSADAVVRHPSRSGLFDLLKKRRRVAGGAWTRREVGLLRLVKAEVGGGLRKTLRVTRSPALRFSEKLTVVPIVLLMAAVSIGELLRLAAGGEPRRA